ncbi:MAG: MATE family efflux transporter [Lachnospiraceae bacterium]|nr:MATE family efflux transporter [Lachnospiraceae bacterium]
MKKGKKIVDFTNGPILGPMMKFMLPVLLALLIQSLYGAVDLLIVGQFGAAYHVSGVSIGANITHLFTALITAIAMGTTIMLGQFIGEGRRKDAGDVIGTSIFTFIGVAIIATAILLIFAPNFLVLLRTPQEALSEGTAYVRICAAGMIFIVAYNVIGSVFRGIGDSTTPLITVAIACAVNIAGDLLLVGVFHMAAAGAAIATIFAQAVSVVASLLIVRRRGMPFSFGKENLKFNKVYFKRIFKLGLPLAAQEVIVSVSFMVVTAVANTLGLIESAACGVGGRLILFIMLVPSSFLQALSAVVAHNVGARKLKRAKRAMVHAIWTSLVFAAIMYFIAGMHGTWITRLFTTDPQVMEQAALYLSSYAIDTFLTSFLFCFIGYFNGCGRTTITLIQGFVGVAIRIPMAFIMRSLPNTNLFFIGLATPISSVFQVSLLVIYFFAINKKLKAQYDSEFNPALLNEIATD